MVNQTGLRALYDLKLEWTPEAALESPNGTGIESAAEPGGPSFFTALQEQLGLRLESRKVSADVVLVDRIERVPTEN